MASTGQHRTWHKKHEEARTNPQRIADMIANIMGSWPFIITQTVVIALWISLNLLAYLQHWDPYPFILLNLLFSTQAAYAAPIIMMSQNRQNERDRTQALADFETNQKAETEIEELQLSLARIENDKLDKILLAVERLSPDGPAR
jgi:uncharacterized membrane protein